MMMCHARRLIKDDAARHVDGVNFSFFNKCLQVTVDRRDADAATSALSKVQDLVNRQRPLGLLEYFKNGLTLLRVSFHRSNCFTSI